MEINVSKMFRFPNGQLDCRSRTQLSLSFLGKYLSLLEVSEKFYKYNIISLNNENKSLAVHDDGRVYGKVCKVKRSCFTINKFVIFKVVSIVGCIGVIKFRFYLFCRNGDLSKPSGGPRGRHFIQLKWKELAQKLNSDGTGDSRSEEKWRKVCNLKWFIY